MGSDFTRVGLGSPNPNALHLALSGETVGPVNSGRSTFSTVLGIDIPVPADGTSDLVLVAKLRDARGNAVPGKTVSLAPHAGASAAATPSSAITDKTAPRHSVSRTWWSKR